MSALKVLNSILVREPEWDLAYLQGHQLEHFPHRLKDTSGPSGLLLRLVTFLSFLIRGTRLRPQPDKGRAEYFVYAGTANQWHALADTVAALRRGGDHCRVAAENLPAHVAGPAEAEPVRFAPLQVGQALWLLLTRGPRLVTSLRRDHHPVALRRYFNTFCASYAYLPYFLDQLRRCRPKTVLISNDHNVSNRALMAVARALKIPVAYLQHASISPLFPPLRVDYAFLDGEASMATYRLCENNPLASADGEPVTVFLSGQKKDVRGPGGQGEFVALAINKLDPVDRVVVLVRHLRHKGEKVKLRWHPAQPAADVQTLRSTFADDASVAFSDPAKQPVAAFFEASYALVAGDSSIHLEAALAGLRPLYHPLDGQNKDYYGYVAAGLAVNAAGMEQLDQALSAIRRRPATEPSFAGAVRFYSATFATSWQGREGCLVAETLRGGSNRWRSLYRTHNAGRAPFQDIYSA